MWIRRQPLYRQCSGWEFCIRKGDEQWGAIERDFCLFFSTISGQRPAMRSCPLPPLCSLAETLSSSSSSSFFVCLTYPDVSDAAKDLPHIAAGTNAIELRVDLLKSMVCGGMVVFRRMENVEVGKSRIEHDPYTFRTSRRRSTT